MARRVVGIAARFRGTLPDTGQRSRTDYDSFRQRTGVGLGNPGRIQEKILSSERALSEGRRWRNFSGDLVESEPWCRSRRGSETGRDQATSLRDANPSKDWIGPADSDW